MSGLIDFFESTGRKDRGISYEAGGSWHHITYDAMVCKASRLAARWLNHTGGRRCICLIRMETGPDYLQALMAVVQMGSIPVPLHANCREEEIRQTADWLEAEIIIADAAKLKQWPAGWMPARLIGLDGRTGDRIDCSTMDSVGSDDSAAGPAPEWTERVYEPPPETAVIMMSSGSTGRPKAIMLSADNLLTNAAAIAEYTALTDRDRVLICKSLGYLSTITGEWLLALQTGADICLNGPLFHPLQLVTRIRNAGATFVCVVPSMIIPLLKSGKWDIAELAALRRMIIIGGAVSPDILLELQAKLPHVELIPSYGLTEAAPRVTYLPAAMLKRIPGSAGRPIRNVRVEIRQDGELLPAGEIGEITVSGPNVMLGYYRDRERTDRVLQPYGLKTADMGYLDEDGFLFITGRADRAVNIAGQTVYPEAVEHILLAHPEIEEAAVCAVSDPVWGSRLIAFAVPCSLQTPTKPLEDYCQAKLPPALRPKRIIYKTSLPKTASGKPDRTQLAEDAAKEEQDAASTSG
ncbi:MAG: acyl-CoA synthetase, AMP-forming [Paenibacillaceae bacterium]|jgi:acyl-CoA synthetase (AMP-forming)/AMP-acid ligase II|nr:acyl-CoA synthetase, AMP-forming [Paenibacillaceae bacterium]